MPDPLRPVRPGDPASEVLRASRHNEYARAAGLVNQQYASQQEGEPHRPRNGPRLICRAKNTGLFVNRFEIVDLGGWRWNPSDNLEAASSVVIEVDTPATYRNWGVALEPMQTNSYGLVAVAGLCFVRLSPRSTAANVFADIHPSPSGRDGYRAANRLHGQARILDITDGYHEDYEIALIDIRGGNEVIDVVSKETVFRDGYPKVYPCLPWYVRETNDTVDTADELTAWAITQDGYGRRLVAAIGYDDSETYATLGQVRWGGDSERFFITQWPRHHLVELQCDVDVGTFPTASIPNVYVKMMARRGSAVYGPFGDQENVRVGLLEDSTQTYPTTDRCKTVSAVEGAMGMLVEPDHAGTPYLDGTPWIDEPYYTLRWMQLDGPMTGTGPYLGWYWCDGESHTNAPDYRDLFPVMVGSSHAVGATGGESQHGDGTNDHGNHLTTTIESSVGGQTVVVDGSHGDTDNEPPWFAAGLAIRLPPDT